jgi:hypothetical protein
MTDGIHLINSNLILVTKDPEKVVIEIQFWLTILSSSHNRLIISILHVLAYGFVQAPL